jgi:hypothetical protein
MLNKSDSDDEENSLRLFYSYIKIVTNINQQLICETADKDLVKVKIDII